MVKENQVRQVSIPIVMLRDGIFPVVLYFAGFAALTYPLLLSFSSNFFADSGDGFQNVWNIWWVNHAVLALQSPWYTSYLHYPYGVSLVGHTLNSFNGFISIVFLRFFTLVQTHNLIVILGFVLGGSNAFLLCKYVTGAYWPSLVGGAVFTFSNYHFAHAQGHLNLVSLEWIPLFVLLWYRLLDKPSVKIGIGSGIALFVVLLCDYYYFLYSVMTGVLMLAWLIVTHRRSIRSVILGRVRAFAAFTLTSLIMCGPLVLGLLLLNARDPLIGAHSDSEFSLDLPALVIPGGHWRFAGLTKFYWSRLPGNIHESSVDLGISVVLLFTFAWFNRSRLEGTKLSLWYLIAATFAVLSLGPTLHVWGLPLPVPLPYRLLYVLAPPLKLTGVPVRMVVMLFLSGGVITACALKLLLGRKSSHIAAALILLVMALEYLPALMPQTSTDVPKYVVELARRPGNGAVLDLASSSAASMYYQTVHVKPLALGYISRVPRSVARRDAALMIAVEDQSYEDLCHNYGIEYMVKPNGEIIDFASGLQCVYRSDGIVDLDRILHTNSVKLAEGSFIKGSTASVYLFTDNTKHLFPNWNTFVRYGGATNLSNVIAVTDRQLAAIPEGQPLSTDEFADAWRGFERPVVEWFRREIRK